VLHCWRAMASKSQWWSLIICQVRSKDPVTDASINAAACTHHLWLQAGRQAGRVIPLAAACMCVMPRVVKQLLATSVMWILQVHAFECMFQLLTAGRCGVAHVTVLGFVMPACQAGGAAHSFRVGGYTFDAGPSFHMGLADPPGTSRNPLKQV
jgi:hypothetical protein